MPYCNRAHSLLDANRDEEALAGYDRAIALEPKFAEAYLGRALALRKLSRVDEALASIDKAIGIKGDVGKMYGARATLLRSLGREAEAVAADAKAAELEAQKTAGRRSDPPRTKIKVPERWNFAAASAVSRGSQKDTPP